MLIVTAYTTFVGMVFTMNQRLDWTAIKPQSRLVVFESFRPRKLNIVSVLFCLTLLSCPVFSQSFGGIVRDFATKEILPYANIGVKKKNIGGISDQSGAFQIDLSRATKADTVVVSYIGYDPHIVSLSNLDFSQRHIIELRPSSHVLKEVVVRSKPEIIILGNKGKSTRHTGWGDFSSSRGRAIGLSIKTPDVSLKINKLFFHLNACEFDSARVRINFLKIKDGDLKSFESQKQNIFVTIHKKKGWIEVPLLDDIAVRNDDLIVAIELLDAWAKPRSMDEGGSYLFTLSLAKARGAHYIRQTPEEPIQLAMSEFTPSIYLECFAIQD